MAHIHTEPGQIDYIAEVFIVHKNKVLFRLHEKNHKWIAPGGHVELDETLQEAAVREAKEEVGLDVVIWRGKPLAEAGNDIGSIECHDLILPAFSNIHRVDENHRHLVFVFFGTSASDQVVQPDNHEKTECRWLTKDEVEAADYIFPTAKVYALKALECLADGS